MLHGVWVGGNRGTKPCVFSSKVAAGGDEGYLVCAAGAAAVVPGSNRFSLGVLQRVVVHVCVVGARPLFGRVVLCVFDIFHAALIVF